MLKPQDVVVVLKIALDGAATWTYASLAHALGMSPSEVHAAVRRAVLSGLLHPDLRRPNRAAFEEFLIHGLKYAFPAERGGVTRGIPTAHSAPPLADEISAEDELPPVWPDPTGTVRGETLQPLYKSVPRAALGDSRLYQGLALLDAIRAGRTRERKLAEVHLHRMLAR